MPQLGAWLELRGSLWHEALGLTARRLAAGDFQRLISFNRHCYLATYLADSMNADGVVVQLKPADRTAQLQNLLQEALSNGSIAESKSIAVSTSGWQCVWMSPLVLRG